MSTAVLPRTPALLAVAALAVALLPWAGPADAAPRAKKADLVVGSASLSVRTAAPGDALSIKHAVRNTGTRKAGRSTTRVHLLAGRSTVPLGSRAVGAVRPRKTVAVAPLAVKVPAVPDGSYVVRVCADDLRKVKERKEQDNCRVAGSLLVRRPTTAPDPVVPRIPPMEVGDLELDSFAARLPWDRDPADAVDFLALFCESTRPVRSFSLPAAVASLEARLQDEAGAGMTALAGSPAYDDPAALQELATAGVVQGSPGLSLAALLRAAELEPTVGTHLVGAASIATSIGMPNEAIALLDAAASRTFRAPAMGIPHQAIAATVRGQAMVLTGRVEQARPWFAAARAAAPLLTEAEAGLATVEACAGEEERAARFIRKSRQRTNEATRPEEETERPDPASQVDLGAGRTTHLRQTPFPATPTQAVNLLPLYRDVLAGTSDETQDHHARRAVIDDELDAADAASTRAERDLRSALIHLGYVTTTPEIEELEDEISQIQLDLVAQKEAFWGGGTGEAPYVYGEMLEDAFAACGPPGCVDAYMNEHCRPALRAEHQRWLGLMQRLQDAETERIALLSQVITSIAAHLAEPAAHDELLLLVESLESTSYSIVTRDAWAWGRQAEIRAHHCVEPLPTETPGTEGEPEVDSAGPCSDDVKKISYKFGLGPSEVKVNCEKVQQEFSVEVLPLLHAFAEVSYDFRSGTVTVVAGAKAKGGVGGGEGSFKSGVYVSVETRNGSSVKDVGWQVGPEVTGTVAGVEAEVYKDEMDISFIAGLRGE